MQVCMHGTNKGQVIREVKGRGASCELRPLAFPNPIPKGPAGGSFSQRARAVLCLLGGGGHHAAGADVQPPASSSSKGQWLGYLAPVE